MDFVETIVLLLVRFLVGVVIVTAGLLALDEGDSEEAARFGRKCRGDR